MCASALLLAACGKEKAASNQVAQPTQNSAETGTVVFGAGTRDRLCLKGRQVAFITYADGGNANCALHGTLNQGSINPDGDTACSVPLTRAGDRVTLGGAASPACAYYCGPGASFSGKTLTRLPSPKLVTDVAGDPLC